MMNERELRDFNAGLSEEVDAWLRGDTSRRSFLTKLILMGGAAMVPGLGFTAAGSEAWAQVVDLSKVELADKSTPLGQTQAAAVKASTEGPTDGSAFRAVQAAQRYKGKGVTLNLTYEAGLQALEPKNFSGPLWQGLTGINFNVVELPHPDQYSKPIAEHIANSGAYDVLDIEPAWIPALANGGAIVPIDDYVAKYMNLSDLDDYHPLYKSITLYKGKRWGAFDDGDQFALYYRKDIFEDPKLKSAYQAKFGKPLALPATWDDYSQVAQFITDQLAPNVYGAAHFRKFGSPGNQFSFLQQFRANGGKFFDADMKAQLATQAGITTLDQMIAQNKASIPGNNDLDAVAQWAAWLQGKVAMIFSWPPTGRISSNYAQRDKAINFIPQSSIADKVGYAVMPGGNGEMASGYVRALAAGSANEEAAYLFMQWVSAPPLSLVRTMLPYTLRDPYRLSTYKSEQYRALWPAAKDYLITLCECSNTAVVDMIMPGWQDYALTIDRMCTSVWGGQDPKAALQGAAAEWDAVTKRLGIDAQKAAYQQFLQIPGSYADHTIEKLGQSVHIT
ncbi:carbohydrate ABC transporter substrate-binding protein, CUT1 family [Rhizobiales bacterium GAS188]|nr:carbohydrate ABC transporter substrate-binding protein, CUT1 family [Rhizobiales bacterium GAS188]